MTFPLPLEQFRTNFGPYPVPPILAALLAFENASRDWYSWGFELDLIPQEVLKYDVKEEAISQFVGFGHDGNYSIYALWRYKDIPLEEAPVVYLNSEGEGSGVFSNHLSEFLTLLVRDEEPRFGIYPEKTEEEIEHSSRNRAFREWLEQHYHIQAATHPNEVVRNARLWHPALPLLSTLG